MMDEVLHISWVMVMFTPFNPFHIWFGLPLYYGVWLIIAFAYLIMWASFDLLQDRLLWSLKCKRGDKYFKRNWRNIWNYFFPMMTVFITGLLVWSSPHNALKFFLYTYGFQINGMEDLLYYALQGKMLPKKLPWLPPWLNSRTKILIAVAGYLIFILTFLELALP